MTRATVIIAVAIARLAFWRQRITLVDWLAVTDSPPVAIILAKGLGRADPVLEPAVWLAVRRRLFWRLRRGRAVLG